ncbi:MAG: hypothetical protein PHQ40_21595, partial [Anaerolineaceae bacterium]|nr:hypothetical protein [Anaerolineaceae bacterium]
VGFAGQPVIPISEPRGLPEDFTINKDGSHPIRSVDIIDPWRRKYHEEGGPLEIWMGDHSHSWLTGEEMLAWTAITVMKTGIISRQIYEAWDRESQPSEWCGGITGPGIRVVNYPVNNSWTHIRVYWRSDLGKGLAYFFDEVSRLVEEHGEIRFVFGFMGTNNETKWLVRALVALAKRHLADANSEAQDGEWPAGHGWRDLSISSQHIFMHQAREEAGIPHAEYEALIEAAIKVTSCPRNYIGS